jgi:hypothetical protein
MTPKQKTVAAVAGCGVASVVLLLCCGGIGGAVWWNRATATPTLVGKWNGPGGHFWQFEKDGTFIMGQGAGGMKGTYRLVDENHFETDFGGLKARRRFTVTANRLDIEEEGELKGMVITFERAK